MKILIVDDNPDDRKVLRYTVEGHGHQAIEAENGLDGLQKAKDHRPDLVISDALMPQMDGFQFLWALKKEPETKEVPFVFYSASYKGTEDIHLAKSLGANAYLIKPMDPNELWSRIKEYLTETNPVPAVPTRLANEDAQFLKHYGRMVATKLEKKVRELEQTLEERRRAEETLRESQNFIRNILDSVDEGFIVVDRNYRILSANRAFCTMVNCPEEEVKGRLCYELSHAAVQPCFEVGDDCPVKQTLETGRPHMVAHVHEHPSGTKSYVELKSYPITNGTDRVVSVIETINDVTEKRRLEDQLHQAQKLESIGQLAGGVAHDFNNMLAVILGRTQLAMRKTPREDPLYASLQEIHKAAERSANLTRQLLAFARKQVILPQAMELNEALEGMLKMLRSLIGEDIELTWIPGSVPLPIKMDPVQLDQILANLCVNSRDAIESDGKITIETQQAVFDSRYCGDHVECLPGEYALLSVSDNGQGMNKSILPRIFEPFFTTKEVGRGTGLGLATVYGIVKQNGGFINVYSEPEQGTTVKIYLPRHSAEAVRSYHQDQASQPARGDETILLVEDEPGLLSIAQQMLEDCGYRVLPAATPQEALGLADRPVTKIDLLITDVVMPGMNGRELMKKLTAESPQLKCLFMSGYPTNVIVRHGILEEGVHFIQKPFTLEDLADKVRSALS
jgi:PAS domain S-box-containing protein